MKKLRAYFKSKKALQERAERTLEELERLMEENKELQFENLVLHKSLDEAYEKNQALRVGRSTFYGK